MHHILQLATFKALAFILLVSGACAAEAQVTVSGVVTDSAGEPLTRCQVDAMPLSADRTSVVGSRLNPWRQVDSQGRFTITLQPGRYKILAKDDLN